jgi:hypothetical protein
MRRALPLVRLQCRRIAEPLVTPFARELCDTRVLLYLMVVEGLLSTETEHALSTERVCISCVDDILHPTFELFSALLASVRMDTLFVIL